MYMIMFVLDDPKKLDPILDAWENAGVRGVTIIESSGIQRRRIQQKRIPMRYNIDPMLFGNEKGNLTLFTIVENETKVDQCIQAVDHICGDLDQPNTGVLACWPLHTVRGLPRQ
ncbi:MAG: hypothetical protein GYA17_02180 [Chloroflexi bacterium]|nr:hypothetical protein [Chloroflexota bacterium]